MNKWCQNEIDEMLEVVAETKTVKEVFQVFNIILTPREINDMARRLAALGMIMDGKSYAEITQRLGLSPNTISKISAGVGFGFRRCSQATLKKKEPFVFPFRIVKCRARYKGAPTYRIKLGTDF